MNSQEITVTYRWTAQPGKLDELKAIYEDVLEEMKANEPDTLKMECYVSEESNELIVHDVFKDGAALGTHLGGTAARHVLDRLVAATERHASHVANHVTRRL